MARAAAGSGPAAGQQPVRLALHAMACRFELVLAGGDGHGFDETRLRAVGEEALAEVRRCEAAWSLFRRDSVVARLNREAGGGPVRVDSETFDLLRLCKDVHARSGGAFDPTVAAWMRARGLHDGSFLGAAEPEATGMDGVLLDDAVGSVRFARPGLALDLGAVGKGMALDLAAAVLREHRVTNALLHGGTSSVIALGAPPGAEGWRVRIGSTASAPTALLAGAAVSVSAPHGRSARGPDGSVTHVLDPLTGRPSATEATAAVIAGSAAIADAWSTALLAGGQRLLSACPGPAVLASATGRWFRGGGRAPAGSGFSFPSRPSHRP